MANLLGALNGVFIRSPSSVSFQLITSDESNTDTTDEKPFEETDIRIMEIYVHVYNTKREENL